MSSVTPTEYIKRARNDLFKPESIAQWVLIIVIGTGIIVPLIFLLLQAFGETPLIDGIPSSYTLDHVTTALTQDRFQTALWNTMRFVGGGIILAHILGFINAYILTKMDVPFAGKFHVLMFLPIFLSSIILSLGINQAFLNGGVVDLFFGLFGMEAPGLRNVYGMIFVGSIYWSPFAYSFLSSGLQNMDPTLEQAAKITGASSGTILRRITLPLIKPFVLSSLFLTLLLGIQSLAIPLILGVPNRVYVLSSYLLALQTSSFPPPYGLMAAVGFILVVISLLIAISVGRLIGDSEQYTVISGRSSETTTHTETWKKAIATAWLCLFVFVGIIIPFVQVLVLGVLEGRELSIQALTLDHFRAIFSSSLATTAIQNSVIIAVVTATVSVLLTGYIAYVKAYETNLRSQAISKLAWIPIATPGVVLGIAYLWTFLYIRVGLYGTIFALMIAFGTRFLALGTRMNESLIVQQSETLDEQGRICGAGLFTRLRRIVFPNMKGGMISIWVILFAIFMNEVSASIFLYTSESRVLTVTLYEYFSQVMFNELGALAIVQLSITLSLVAFTMWLFDIDIRIA